MSDEDPTRRGRAPRSPEARLRLELGGRELLVDRRRPSVRYGRGASNDLVVDDDLVSRRHGHVDYVNGKFYLTDSSTNGTFIVRKHGRTLFVHAERIVLEGQGSIRLGQREGSVITFAAEILTEDGRSWRAEASPDPLDDTVLASQNTFRKEGDYWTIAYEGTVLRLSDAKGLRYIDHLLRHPGREFHVLDLARVAAETAIPAAVAQLPSASTADVRIASSQDAGPMLDAAAKAAYKRRVSDLKDELEEAERFNDAGRAEHARREIEFIASQLAGAVGLGGRDRPASSDAERARVMITLRVKDELKKLRKCHPALGSHLSSTIKTGRFCSYTPDPAHPIAWTF